MSSEEAEVTVGRTLLSARIAQNDMFCHNIVETLSPDLRQNCHPEEAPQADEGSTAAWDQPGANCTWRHLRGSTFPSCAEPYRKPYSPHVRPARRIRKR